MQWHNYVREFISSQREVKAGAWRDSTPRLLQVLVHSIYLSPGTLKAFAGPGLSIGIKIPRKTTTLYSDPISPELVQEETLTESLIEQDRTNKIQVTIKSLFSICYPHSCMRYTSGFKVFLAFGDKRSKLHKVYEALLDLDFLMGTGQSCMVPMTTVKHNDTEAAYAPLTVVLESNTACVATMQSPVVIWLSARSIYPTLEIMSRFSQDLITRVARIVDFSPVSWQSTFTKVEECKSVAPLDAGIDGERSHTDRSHKREKSMHHFIHVDSANLPTHPPSYGGLRAPEVLVSSPDTRTSEASHLLRANIPCSTPLSYTQARNTIRIQPQGAPNIGFHSAFQRNASLTLNTRGESAELADWLMHNYVVPEKNIYLIIVSAFKTQHIERLLSVFGLSQNFHSQDNMLVYTVSQYTNFPMNISDSSSSIPLSAVLSNAPLLMQQNARLTLTHTDQHINSIINLLMQMFPSLMLMKDMNASYLFPRLTDLNIIQRSELISGELKLPITTPSDEISDPTTEDSASDQDEKQCMNLIEILNFVFKTILNRLSDLVTLVNGKESAIHDVYLSHRNLYNVMAHTTSRLFSMSSDAFELLCEFLSIRNNVFFQRKIVFVLYNSELEYPSLIASALQSDDSICYFPLPYNSNPTSHVNIAIVLRIIGLYLALLYKLVHPKNMFSEHRANNNDPSTFSILQDGGYNGLSRGDRELDVYHIFNEGNDFLHMPYSDTDHINGGDTGAISKNDADPQEFHSECIKGLKLSLTSLLLKIREQEDNVYQHSLHGKSQNTHEPASLPKAIPLEKVLRNLGYDQPNMASTMSKTIYIAESGDINAYEIPIVASVMQKNICSLFLTSSDDAHSSAIYNLFSTYNQSVLPPDNTEEIFIPFGEKTILNSLLIKAVMLLRVCASLGGTALTTLHPMVLYPIPVPATVHARLFENSCTEGARAAILGVLTRMTTCSMRGSVSDLIANNDKIYEQLFGTPAWLAIMQCYCSGTISWLYSYIVHIMSTKKGSDGPLTPRDKDDHAQSIYGRTAIGLSHASALISTPVKDHFRFTKDWIPSNIPVQGTLFTSKSYERILKVLETVINQAIKIYLRTQSVAPLIALSVQAEVIPKAKVLRAPQHLTSFPNEDKDKLQLIYKLLMPKRPSDTPSPVVSKPTTTRGLSLTYTKQPNEKSALYLDNCTAKDLISSHHTPQECREESRICRVRRRNPRKGKLVPKDQAATEKKLGVFVCWERVSIYKYSASSYMEANKFRDVQLQMTVGGIPTRDDKGSKSLFLKNLHIYNSRYDINVASTNTFLYTLKINRYIYNFTLYHLIKTETSSIPQIRYFMSPAGDDYKWYTHASRQCNITARQSLIHTMEVVSQTPFKPGNTFASSKKGIQLGDTVITSMNLTSFNPRRQSIALIDSSVTEEHQGSIVGDILVHEVTECKAMTTDTKTSSDRISAAISVSTSTTDIPKMVSPAGSAIVQETETHQHSGSLNTGFKGKPFSFITHETQFSRKLSKPTPSITKSNAKRSVTKSIRESQPRVDSNISRDVTNEDEYVYFASCYNPEQPYQKQISDNWIQQQYLHSFVGLEPKQTSIMLRPEAPLQPYIRPSTKNYTNNDGDIKYVPIELVKVPTDCSVPKVFHDGCQHEVRITSKKAFFLRPDQFIEPILVQSLNVTKSTNDLIVLGMFDS